MADQGRWFKLWAESLSDPHLGNLSVADFGRWAKFGTYLKVHGTDGSIRLTSPCSVLTSALQLPSFDALMTCLASFPNCQIRRDETSVTDSDVTIIVTWRNWRKYQIDSSAERQRRYRHRLAFGVTTKKRGEEKRREEKKEPPIVPHGGTLGFDAFWTRYPRKAAKKAALKAWTKIAPSNGLQEQILTALMLHASSEAWTRDGGQFIPHAASWLNGRRWEDLLGTTEPAPALPVDRKVRWKSRESYLTALKAGAVHPSERIVEWETNETS